MRNQTKLIFIGAIFMMFLSGIIIMAVFDDVEGPLIYQIDVVPIEPVAGDTISITIYCIDSSGVSASDLYYTYDGEEWFSRDMEFFICLCIAGGRWVASFSTPSDASSIQFYVTAYDNSINANPSDSETLTIQMEAS